MTLKRPSFPLGFSISDCYFPFFHNHHDSKNSRSRRIPLAFVAVILLSFGVAKSLHAQALPATSADDQSGMQPYQSYHGGDIDSIGLSNGMLNLNFPLITYPQRGKLHLSFDIFYSDAAQHVGEKCVMGTCAWAWGLTPTVAPFPKEKSDVYVGWGQDLAAFGSMAGQTYQPGPGQYTYYWGNWSIQFADGSKHPLGNQGTSTRTGSSPVFYFQGSGPWETLDASGWRVNGALTATASGVGATAPASFIDPDGVIHNAPNGAAEEDPNGNEITYNGTTFTDSLDRQIPTPPNSFSSSNTGTSACPQNLQPLDHAVLWTVPGPNGGTENYTFCYADITVNLAPLDRAPGSTSPISQVKLQSIVMPNGQSWDFQYNDPGDGSTFNGYPINYGTLTQITLPTGGTISYTYLTESSEGAGVCNLVGRWVATRSVNANDGTGSHQWTYSYTINVGGASNSTTVTDPVGNYVVHTFGVGSCQPYETDAKYYQVGGALLKTVDTIYAHAGSSNAGPSGIINVVPTTITTTWPNAKVSTVGNSYDAGFSYIDYLGSTTYQGGPPNVGLYGKLLTKTESDFGGTILRTTTNTYQALNSSTYLTNNLLNLPASIKVTGASQTNYTTYGYDENAVASSGISIQHDSSPPTGTARGNQTSIHRQLNNGSAVASGTCPAVGSGGYLVTSVTFFDTGMVDISKDPCTYATTYAYSGTYIGAFPTTVTNALNQSTTHTYDLNTGLLTSTTDPNGQTTSFTYDNMWRLASVTYPDGGSSVISHQETSFPNTATLTKKITSSQNYVTKDVFDGVGRVSQSQVSPGTQTIFTDFTYDADGRKSTVSNPYYTTSDSTYGVTTYQYDGLSRTTLVTPPGGSGSISTQYCGGNATLVTDESGHWRRSQLDGLGRLVEVDEPNSTTATVNVCPGTGEPIWTTNYTYDALDDLMTVSQGGSHNRSFAYDSLKRLTSSLNPETGTTAVLYGYDADSNVVSKTDARAITINYSYDSLNRMLGRTYSNGDTSVGYQYDTSGCSGVDPCYNIGRRTVTAEGSNSQSFSYDSMGRLTGQHTHNGSIFYVTTYSYDFNGDLTSLTYPSGRIVRYAYDNVGRPISAVDTANGINYATAGTYAPQGAIASLTLGASIDLTGVYNSRLQPCWIYESSAGGLPTSTSCTASATAGNILDLKYSYLDPSGRNNGNVIQITNNKDTTRTQAFTYDQVNRIVAAETSSTQATSPANCWGESYTLDEWANLTTIGVASSAYTGCTQESLSVSVSNNNQISSFSYDAAGNVLNDTRNAYVWNAESEIKTGAGVNYTYDADGNRVQKSSGKIYWYGGGSEVLDESDSSGNITDEYVFLGGKRIAHRVVSGNSIYYYAEDFLGTSRVIATAAGSVCYEADFYPFGGERDVTNTCTPTYKFEGKERDTETNNDDFGARYYSSQFGRWTSPDWSSVPVPVPYANLTNPQTLNLYAMVHDNPESFADLDGHEDDGSSGDVGASTPVPQQQSSSTPQNQSGQSSQQPNSGSAQSQTPSMNSSTPTPQQQNTATIGPNPNWLDGRQADCIGQGLKSGGEELLPLHDEIKAVSDSIADGSAKPLKELLSLGTAAEAGKEGAKKVVETRAAQKAVKSLIKSAGGRASANAVGRAASLTMKAFAVITLAIAVTTALNGYQSCMAY